VSVTIQGGPALTAALALVAQEARRHVEDAVNATGLELRTDIIKRYQQGPKTGVLYVLRNPNREHQASSGKTSPPEAPATDTGRLANSVLFRSLPSARAEVFTDVVYGAYLEFGTQRILPRPAWRPAAEAATPKFRERLERALRRATGR
jgi:hypothetical protein